MSNEDDIIAMGVGLTVVLAIAVVPIMSFLIGRSIGNNEIEPQIVEKIVIQECEPITATTTPKIAPKAIEELRSEEDNAWCWVELSRVNTEHGELLVIDEKLGEKILKLETDYNNILVTCKETNE